MVAVGLGVALIPRLGLTSVRDDASVISLSDTAPVRRVLLACQARRRHTPASNAMMAVFLDVAPRHVAPASQSAKALNPSVSDSDE
jgi:DNA-binding transcriptional LysR family regulator